MTLDCKHVLAELSDYLDDDVGVELARAIAEHLAHCIRCSTIYDTTRKTLTIVSDADPIEVPLAASARLYSRLQQMFTEGPSTN